MKIDRVTDLPEERSGKKGTALVLSRRSLVVAAVGAAGLAASARAQSVPKEIKIGHLYASSGPIASTSMPIHDGLKIWVDEVERAGGVFVKPFGRQIPIRLIAYDDQGSPATVTALTNRLITQDKVEILIGDASSLLTAPEAPIAREYKTLLFDPSGTGSTLFSRDNPYIVLTGVPASIVWPRYLADFLLTEGVAAGIRNIALLYCTNDFTGPNAASFRGFLANSKAPLKLVYDQGVPTTTSDYTVPIQTIMAHKPDAIIEFGFPDNDIAFFRGLQNLGVKPRFVFAVYPGLETALLRKTVGDAGMFGAFTYVTAATIQYKPDVGMTLSEYKTAWEKAYHGAGVEFGWNAVIGYQAGLIAGAALGATKGMTQLDLREAVASLSGKIQTLNGTFAINELGEQVGELTPIGQMQKDTNGSDRLVVVYPPANADGKAVFGPM